MAQWLAHWQLPGKPAISVCAQPSELSLSSLQGRQIEYQPVWVGLDGARSLVSGSMCDPISHLSSYTHQLRDNLFKRAYIVQPLIVKMSGAEHTRVG